MQDVENAELFKALHRDLREFHEPGECWMWAHVWVCHIYIYHNVLFRSPHYKCNRKKKRETEGRFHGTEDTQQVSEQFMQDYASLPKAKDDFPTDQCRHRLRSQNLLGHYRTQEANRTSSHTQLSPSHYTNIFWKLQPHPTRILPMDGNKSSVQPSQRSPPGC